MRGGGGGRVAGLFGHGWLRSRRSPDCCSMHSVCVYLGFQVNRRGRDWRGKG